MKQFIKVTAAVALAGASSPAFAGGPTVVTTEQPPVSVPAPAPNFDWTGPSVGLQLGYGDVETSGAAALEGDDVLYGLRAYYDYDFGQYIVGGGLQYDSADIDLGGVTSIDSVTRLAVRGGLDLDRNWVYATAGYAYAETSAAAVGDSNGYFVGAGYEVFVAPQVTLGAEVLYHEFDDFDLGGLEAEATTAALSVNFRF